MLDHKVIFAYVQPNSIRIPLNQSQNISETTTSIGRKLHPANWTHLGTLQMLAKT